MVAAGRALAGRALLPAALRRPAGGIVVVAVLVFGLLATRYGGESAPRWLDHRIAWLVDTTGPLESVSDAVITFGGALSVAVLAGLHAALALTLGHRRLAVLAVVGPGLTGLATILFKPLVGRTFYGDFAYPSGHAAGATAIGIVASLLLISVLNTASRGSAALLVTGALLSGGTMAFALVASNDHYPTDTIGGFCLAVATLLTSALVIDSWTERAAEPARPGSPP